MDNNQQNDSMFWVWFIDAATVIAAAMLYMKTSEVMTAIAPLTLLGMTGLQVLYGVVTAGLIEGVTLALHFVPRFRHDTNATVYKAFLFIVSGFCQFLDKQMVIDAGKAQSEIQVFFGWIALGIPLAVFGGLLWVAGSTKNAQAKVARKPFKGVRKMWKELLDGENTEFSSNTVQTFNQSVPPVQTSAGKNGKATNKANTPNP